MDQQLCALASIRAQECILDSSNTRPDGRNWSTVLADHNYAHGGHAQEIRICCSNGFPADILTDTWMSADSSRSSILSPNATVCGIGIAYNGSTMYVVVIFTD